MNQAMVRHPEPNGPSLWVLQAFGHFACCRKNEGVWPWRHRFDQSIRPVIDSSVGADLGKIAANQREVVFLVRSPNPVDSINCPFVTDVGTQCIARVGRVSDQPAVPNDLDNRRHTTRLRVGWVHFYEYSHARIVGIWAQDARP